MRDYKNDILEAGRELEFPEEGTQALFEAWEKLAAGAAMPGETGKNAGAAVEFLAWIEKYERDEAMDYGAALEAAKKAGEQTGVHPYTAQLLLFLCMTAHLKELYEEKGICTDIWRDSCKDLKWKLLECYRMYGIWGSFVAGWFPGFFELTRFALGRLQFELVDFPEGYEKAGRKKPEQMTKAINVHIPSCGKLNMDECHASYRQAADFFSEYFPGDEVAVCCESWMLYLPHKQFLGADSGVVRFMDEYDIYETYEQDGDLWRIFNCDYQGDPDGLAEDTGMQRGYKRWLQQGHHAGCGKGVFFLKKA